MSADGSARLRELQMLQKDRGLSEAEWEEAALLLAAAGRPEEAQRALHRAARQRAKRSRPVATVEPPPTMTDVDADTAPPPQPVPRQGRISIWYWVIIAIYSLPALVPLLLMHSCVKALNSPPSSSTSRSSTSRSSSTEAQATLVGSRLVATTTGSGQPAKMVMVDWRNTGSVPIRSVFADIVAYDANGARLQSGAPDYCVFVVDNASPGVQPGQVHYATGPGFLLMPVWGDPVRCSVRITRATERTDGF